MDMCRDRVGLLPVGLYKLLTCSMCYFYLFQNKKDLKYGGSGVRLISINGTEFEDGTVFYPNIENDTIADMICQTLNEFDCKRWTSCCRSAVDCCKKQRETANYTGSDPYCPRTWDGFGCFDDTPASEVSIIKCPEYIDMANPMADAYKTCTANGTWFLDPDSKKEWTDYTGCVKIDNYKVLFQVGLACHVISILFLIPACAIFLYYRQLRTQQRIKLHICLFFSFIITAFVIILWDVLVFNDRMVNDKTETLMYQDTPGCKILYILTRYAVSTTYVWMFLEGFHLHRLIVKAFKVPKSLVIYHIIGWGFSFFPIIGYAAVRLARQDKRDCIYRYTIVCCGEIVIAQADGLCCWQFDTVRWKLESSYYALLSIVLIFWNCWVYHAGGYEWIVYLPNLLCIVFNLFFLGNILRILMTQLQSHPNEPSNYRRALKATFILVPLFGIQLFLIIFRPPSNWEGSFAYEVLGTIIKNSQGAMVAFIFCFMNGEVHTHIKGAIPLRFRQKPVRSDMGRTNSVSTQYTTESTRAPSMRAKVADDKRTYIPLKTMVDEANCANGSTQNTPIFRNKK